MAYRWRYENASDYDEHLCLMLCIALQRLRCTKYLQCGQRIRVADVPRFRGGGLSLGYGQGLARAGGAYVPLPDSRVLGNQHVFQQFRDSRSLARGIR